MNMDIIQFIEDPELLNDQSLSLAQKVSLKAIYGLELDKTEKAVFRKIPGLRITQHMRKYLINWMR